MVYRLKYRLVLSQRMFALWASYYDSFAIFLVCYSVIKNFVVSLFYFIIYHFITLRFLLRRSDDYFLSTLNTFRSLYSCDLPSFHWSMGRRYPTILLYTSQRVFVGCLVFFVCFFIRITIAKYSCLGKWVLGSTIGKLKFITFI